jgi:hypothetical protein
VHDDPGDTELEEELRRVASQFEPVPAVLLQAALDAYGWRTADAELADLVFDSLADHREDALVRGAGDGRLLSFHAQGLSIEVEVSGTGASRRLIGQLVPPQHATVDIRHGGDLTTTTVETDELGRFSAETLLAGPVSMRCRTGEDANPRRVVTEWISI